MYDIIVIDRGPAGLSVAINSANFGLRTLVLEAAELEQEEAIVLLLGMNTAIPITLIT